MTAARPLFHIKLLFIVACILPVLVYGQDPTTAEQQARVAQLNQVYDATNFKVASTQSTGVPSFFAGEGTRGSPYLTRHWLAGIIQSVDSQTARIQYLFAYNYDKLHGRLVATKDGRKVVTVPFESVSDFILIDSFQVYSFEKVPFINPHYYFQPIVKSARYLSLYKHLMTRMHLADYTSVGYASFGKRYNEYIDSYDYYIVFPDQQTFQKVSLHKKSILKVLKQHRKEVKNFFSHHDGPLTEELLSELIETLNDQMPMVETM